MKAVADGRTPGVACMPDIGAAPGEACTAHCEFELQSPGESVEEFGWETIFGFGVLLYEGAIFWDEEVEAEVGGIGILEGGCTILRGDGSVCVGDLSWSVQLTQGGGEELTRRGMISRK